MKLGLNTTIRNARVNAIRDAIDAGTGAGTIDIYSGAQPATGGTASPAAWSASTAYAIGDVVQPTSANGHYYRCTAAGTSGSTEPTWPTNGSTVPDGGATWQDVGAVPVLLGTGTFSDPSAGGASNATLTFSTITGSNAVADGTATWARIKDSAGNFVADLDVGGPGSGAALTLNTVSIVSGGPIQFNTNTITDGNA